MTEDMMIGEFSERTGISKRMVRHFDHLGLLVPNYIDETNGYRYYSYDQIQMANNIKTLQDLGFSLKDIHHMLTNIPDSKKLFELLKDQEVKLRNQSDQKIGQLLKLKKLIDYIISYPDKMENLKLDEMERSLPMTTYETLKEEMKRLPSAQMMSEQIEEVYEKIKGIRVFFITFDIDEFLHVNDDYGYDTGDRVIFIVFGIIKDCFSELMSRDTRHILSRLGGDEFALFIVDALEEEILEKVDQTLEMIRNHDFSKEGCAHQLTSSCGISSTTAVKHPADLRHHSTKALLSAKREGRDRYVVINT